MFLTDILAIEFKSTMGIVSSICKRKKRDHKKTTIHNNLNRSEVSTVIPSPSVSNDTTQCCAISREPTQSLSSHYDSYQSPNHSWNTTSNVHGQAQENIPLFSRPFYLPHNGKSKASYSLSNPYAAQTHGTIPTTTPNIDRSRAILTTSINDRADVISGSNPVQSIGEQYRQPRHIDTSMKTDKNEQHLQTKADDESHLVKRSVSAPIDMFLIDISHEHVLVDQPITMNIRHLFLDTLENHHTNSSTPIRIEPSSVTTYAHENLIDYIPHVCERYPNVTVGSDQPTRNTLHLRIPSQFSRSLNGLN